MTKPNAKLISDLGRIAAKYPAREWQTLVELLDDDQKRNEIRQLLIELGNASKSRKPAGKRSKRKPSKSNRIRAILDTIRSEDQRRADLLDDIWLKLRQRELLPTLAAVRTFTETMGFKRLEADRREQAVTELMERLLELQSDELEERMRETVVADRQLNDEYERWVQLILRRPTTPPDFPAGEK